MTYRRVTQLAAEILRTGKPPIRVTQVAAEIVRSAARPEMRVTQVAAEVLWTGRQSMRVTQLAAEVLRTAARPSTRVTQLAAEILWGGNSSMRVSQLALEVLRTGAPRMRVTQLALEALRTAVRPTMRVTQLALEILRLQGLAVTATLLPALFPPGTADPFRLRIAYLTDVLTARSGIEQRRQLRACPAGEMTWSTGPLSELEAQELAGLIYAGQAVGHMVPLWPFPRYLASDVVLHDSSLLLLPGPALFWWGMRAALVRPGHAEVYSIASIEDDPPTLHLSTAVTSSWPAGSSIFPIATGYLRPQQAQIWEALAIAGATLTFDIPSLGQLHAGGSPAPPEILGAEVLEVEPNRVGPVEDMNDRRLDLFDPRTGAVWIDAPSSAPRLARNFLWTILDEDQVLPLIAFLDRRRGQGLPFFVPSWQQDLTLASAVEAGADRITVERCGYSQQMWEIGASRRTTIK